MIPLTNEELKSHENAGVCCILGKYFLKKLAEDMNHWKVRDRCQYTGEYTCAAHSICEITFGVPDEIPAVFHNGSKYNYHFITKKLANKFEGKFECIWENNQKYETFSIPIK